MIGTFPTSFVAWGSGLAWAWARIIGRYRQGGRSHCRNSIAVKFNADRPEAMQKIEQRLRTLPEEDVDVDVDGDGDGEGIGLFPWSWVNRIILSTLE